MRKEKSSNKSLFITIGGIILIIVAIFGIYKLAIEKKTSPSSDKPNSPSKNPDNPSSIPLNKLSDQELEKCLLEDFSRRLDLQKYFVFNIGKELGKKDKDNSVKINGKLSRDLTKLSSSIREKLKEKGFKFRSATPWVKELIAFVDKSRSRAENEWTGNNLERQLENNKDKYFVIEKDDEFEKCFFWEPWADETGQIFQRDCKTFYLRVKTPTTHLKNKSEVLGFLKNNDPAISGKN